MESMIIGIIGKYFIATYLAAVGTMAVADGLSHSDMQCGKHVINVPNQNIEFYQEVHGCEVIVKEFALPEHMDKLDDR